jgi:lipopolysaccharide biosynthesis protein
MTTKITLPSEKAMSSNIFQASSKSSSIARDKSKIVAFYLPQFHEIHENSIWWGPGFTEWTNVAKARPNFEGHYQPHIPRELGFYDLSNIENMKKQADLAIRYGVSAFCFHYYWFSGRRILEKPINNFLKSSINIDFCFCWANENWTRTWDGLDRDVLLEQKYLKGDEERFVKSVSRAFRDKRYLKIAGKPILIIYRAKEIPDPLVFIRNMRKAARKFGFNGLYIIAVDFYDIKRPEEVGADALVEFPPHKFNDPKNIPKERFDITNMNFKGGLVDYKKVILQSALRKEQNFDLYRCLVPSWDNTARRQNTSTVLVGASPELFGAWLKFIRRSIREANLPQEKKIIFVNAWNEWGEGCHLEPDIKYGLSYLDEIYRSTFYKKIGRTTENHKSNEIYKELIEEIYQIESRYNFSKELKSDLLKYGPTRDFIKFLASKLKKNPLLYRFCKKIYDFFTHI